MKADISVVIPLYNKEQIIERTIKSVINQTYPNFELIIVNDGSTDNSVGVVQKISDKRIVLINQPNAGPSAARNTGVRHAKTEWIIFLDGDDEFLPNALEHFVFLKDCHANIDIFDCSRVTRIHHKLVEKINPIEGVIKNNLKDCFYGNIGPGTGHTMFRKELCEKFEYDKTIRRFEDAELLIRMLPHASVYSARTPVFIVNVEFSSASKKRKDITEDYAGHLSMKGKSFWARMCVYRTYLENRDLYPDEMQRLYPTWRYRYDWLILYKLLNLLAR